MELKVVPIGKVFIHTLMLQFRTLLFSQTSLSSSFISGCSVDCIHSKRNG